MKKKTATLAFLLLAAVLLSVTAGCNNSSSPTEPVDTDTTRGGYIVRKPNIYIYPEVKSIVSIKFEFPLGGSVIESIPAYQGGWVVEAEPSGRINNQYDYLYYESRTPDAYQYSAGWIVRRDSLQIFFRDNLSSAGFNGRETDDFIDYWIPRLVNHSYYLIYPQFASDIDKIIKLKIDKAPDNLLRLFYIIRGSEDSQANILKPEIPEFERSGFVVTEWGVVLK